MIFRSLLALYHYTNKEAADCIEKDQKIKKSEVKRRDAFHGDGVYFTTMPPYMPREQIIRNNWDGVSETQVTRYVNEGMVNYVVRVEIPTLDRKLRLVKETIDCSIYLYTDDVYLGKFWSAITDIA